MATLLSIHARNVIGFLRLRPFDTATGEGRSRERYRRIAITTLASGTARAISLVTMLVTVPITVRYLGTERYSLWMTISSMVAMMTFADLGIGNGLLNAISESHGKDDHSAAASYVSSAFFMLLAIGGAVAVVTFALYHIIPWPSIFNVKSPLAVHEAGPASIVFLSCFAFSLPVGVVQRIQLGYQEGYRMHLWIAAGSLIGLAGVLFAIHLRASLPWLVLAVTGGPLLATAINGSVLFAANRPWLRPSLSAVNMNAARGLFHTGAMFFIVQVAMAVGYQADNIVIAQILGAEQVAQYAVPFKLFSVTPMLLAMIMMPLWPAYGEAIARGDGVWISRTLKRSIMLGLGISIPVNAILVAFGREIVYRWAGPQISPSYSLLAGLGIWGVMAGLNWPLAMFLNGINAIRFQAACASAMAVTSILLAIILTRTVGLPGAIYAMVLAQTFCALLPMAVHIPRLTTGVRPAQIENARV